jgi:Protein of unknown function (DUF1059)
MNRAATAERGARHEPQSRRLPDFPSQTNCTLTISGEEDEVLTTATQHAVSDHGHQDTSEVRAWLRENLKDELPAGA